MVAQLQNRTSKSCLLSVISILFCFFLLLPQAKAEEQLFSVSANFISNGILLPAALTFQQGSIYENTMFRLGIDLPLTFLRGDVSYIYSFSEDSTAEGTNGLRAYAGIGGDLIALIVFVTGVHAHVGFEFKEDDSAFYVEYTPTYFFGTEDNEVYHKLAAGINFYF